VRSWRRWKKRSRSKFWAIYLSCVWIPLGDRSLFCQVEVVAAVRSKLLLQVVVRSKLLLKGYHLQEGRKG